MLRALLAATLLAAAPASADDDSPSIHRYLANLSLGDSLKTAKELYPPSQDWPSAVEPRGRVTRYRLEPGFVKRFPANVHSLHLGFKWGRLREIQLTYDEERTRKLPVHELAAEYSLRYGPPRESDGRFWWSDGRTVLRVFPAEVSVLGPDKRPVVQLRTAVQLFEQGLFERTD